MGIFDTILFILFVLPALLIKEAFEMIVKKKTRKQRKKILFNLILYGILGLLVVLAIILWLNGFR